MTIVDCILSREYGLIEHPIQLFGVNHKPSIRPIIFEYILEKGPDPPLQCIGQIFYNCFRYSY